jgi:hypothetical protein
MNKKNVILTLLIVFMTSGCSLLKIASQPFKNTVSKVPQSVSKAERKISCKGEITLDDVGRVTKCGSNYYSYEKTFNQEERKLKLREKISQFILNAKGYMFWGIIIMIVLSLSGFGWVVGAFFSVLRGTGRVARDLVRGIGSAKRYVRSNGDKYNDDEKKIYQKALDDVMGKISDSVDTKSSKKIINLLRAKE